MVVVELILFLFSLIVLVKSAEYAVGFASRVARFFRIPEFIVSFFIISFISCFPEGTVSIISAFEGMPEFGLGTLLGSNVADLCLVFGLVAIVSSRGVTVKSEVLKNDLYYMFLFLMPILLGVDGQFSRLDGALLILSGIAFFIKLSVQSKIFRKRFNNSHDNRWMLNLVLLAAAMAVLMAIAYFTVEFGVAFANGIGIPPFLIALTVVSIGTCMPELVFSLSAVKTGHDELALGDVLGTVIIDATILVGLMAIISPFDFNPSIILITGVFMLFSGYLVISFIKSGKILTRMEGVYLLMFYALSLLIEFIMNYFA